MLYEVITVIASYGDIMGIRAFAERRDLATEVADREYEDLAKLVDVPLINMESAIQHPSYNFV